uniref:hypothetical protein n=1 Tax=Bacillus sp. WP8 TaxID=756828 RepID=UPI001C930B4E
WEVLDKDEEGMDVMSGEVCVDNVLEGQVEVDRFEVLWEGEEGGGIDEVGKGVNEEWVGGLKWWSCL